MSYVLQKYNYALEKWLPVKEYITKEKAEYAKSLAKKKDRGMYQVIKNEQ